MAGVGVAEWWEKAADEAEAFAAGNAARHSPSESPVDAAQQDAIDAARLTPDAVLAYWARTMLDETQASNVRLKASELGAKHLGMLVDRAEIHTSGENPLGTVSAELLGQFLGMLRGARVPAGASGELPPVDVTPRSLNAPAAAADALPEKRENPAVADGAPADEP